MLEIRTQGARNVGLDAAKGIAAIFVVITHVLGKLGLDGGFLMRIVFTVQIPLFMLVSGYLAFKGKPITPREGAARVLSSIHRLLLPFAAWWLLRNLLAVRPDQDVWSGLLRVLYDIPSGLWFLLTLFIFRCVFTLAEAIASKARGSGARRWVFLAVLFCFEALFVFQWFGGSRFLGPEYSGFYLPFFFLGYAFRAAQQKGNLALISRAMPHVSTACVVVWIFTLANFDVVHMAGYREVIVRAVSGIAGSVAVLWLIEKQKGRIRDALALAGRYSLEIYATHMLYLGLIRPAPPEASGVTHAVAYFLPALLVILALTILTFQAIKRFPLLNAVLYGGGFAPGKAGVQRAADEGLHESAKEKVSD